MPDHAFGEHARLGRAKEEPSASGFPLGQDIVDAGIRRRRGQTPFGIPLAIVADRDLGIGVGAEQTLERPPDRGPDDPAKVFVISHGSAHARQGVATAADDAFGRIDKRTVEVEKENLLRRGTFLARHSEYADRLDPDLDGLIDPEPIGGDAPGLREAHVRPPLNAADLS